MLRRSVALAAVLAACSSCGSCGETAPPPDAGPSLPEPVPAPDGLVATARVPSPDKVLTALREASGRSALVPRSAGSLAVQWFGLPLQAAEHFDEDLPIVAAAATIEGKLGVAVAFHVRQSSRIVAVATQGNDNPFTAAQDGASGVLLLEPTGKSLRGAPIRVTLGLLDNHLVVGDSVEALRKLAPYLTRTLARESGDGLEVRFPKGGGGGALLQKLLDGVDASALPGYLRTLLDVDSALGEARALAKTVEEGRVTIAFADGGVAIDADLALAKDALAGLEEVAPKELLTLPDDTLGAVAWSESADSRAAGTATRAEAVGKALGAPWAEADTRALATTFDDLARGRGAESTLAIRCTGVGLTGIARGEVSDGKRLGKALDAVLALRDHPAVKAKLAASSIALDARRMKILEIPEELWRLRLDPAKEGADEIDLLVRVTDAQFYAAAGLETVATMQHLAAPEAERSLGSHELMAAALGRLPERAWLAAAVDPAAIKACRIGKPGGADPAPLVVALRRGADGHVLAQVLLARGLLPFVAKELF
jgi:hypothetical protein